MIFLELIIIQTACRVIATWHTSSLFKGFYFSKKLFEFMSSKVYFNYLPRVQLVFVYFVANILQNPYTRKQISHFLLNKICGST